MFCHKVTFEPNLYKITTKVSNPFLFPFSSKISLKCFLFKGKRTELFFQISVKNCSMLQSFVQRVGFRYLPIFSSNFSHYLFCRAKHTCILELYLNSINMVIHLVSILTENICLFDNTYFIHWEFTMYYVFFFS